ncbi:MAG: hypothetical protein MJA31_09550 [Clostridia bacterium]|nr:hypothetical protein [Clostridia bacterium]
MEIQVFLHEPLHRCSQNKKIEQSNLTLIYSCGINVGELIENLGISSRYILLLKINKKVYKMNNTLINKSLIDGDYVELFPKMIGG